MTHGVSTVMGSQWVPHNRRHEENGLRTLVTGKVEFKRVVQTSRVQRNL